MVYFILVLKDWINVCSVEETDTKVLEYLGTQYFLNSNKNVIIK
jgi:hypothetical protein